jgi:hypothetical protein
MEATAMDPSQVQRRGLASLDTENHYIGLTIDLLQTADVDIEPH